MLKGYIHSRFDVIIKELEKYINKNGRLDDVDFLTEQRRNELEAFDNVDPITSPPINELEQCVNFFIDKSKQTHNYKSRRTKFFGLFIKENQESSDIFSEHEQTTYKSKEYSNLASTFSGLDEMFERISTFTANKEKTYHSDMYICSPEEKMELVQRIDLSEGYSIKLTKKGLHWLNKYRKTKKLKNLRPKKNGYFIDIPNLIQNKLLFG